MKKILVANRGEIALRVMKTAKKMGIKTVAVYSDIDSASPHVLFADESVHIGNNPSSDSYLDMDKVIDAAKTTGADGIHPGYGFLSENSEFAKQVTKEGIIFIGPSPEAIEVMGSKLAAKEAVKSFDIPMVPGTDKAIESKEEAHEIAKSIGFPILIKASAGGGGKGMRIVNNIEELPEQMDRAVSEAISSFGDGSVFIEKYVGSPRHIEIQILADNHGNIVHLFERECSIQRRHQKVVEEAPSCVLTDELRDKMGRAAVDVARACNYSGAGTVEFLLDENLNFYFLEMNTRLQVEHPVTELITDVDLVEQQINIARNEVLNIEQDDLKINGHAIELRVYAEDPLNDFLPSVGVLESYHLKDLPDVRLDSGYYQGMEIPIYYDPMLAKLIAYGQDRISAIQKLKEAIKQFKIKGIETTLPFGLFVCEHEAFIDGEFDTHFVKKYYSKDHILEIKEKQFKLAAKAALHFYLENQNKLSVAENDENNWYKSRMINN